MRIGVYELLSELGRGGRGTVHRALAPDGRTVAVKLLAGVVGQDELAAFEREKRLLAQFTEAEGFVPILDSGTAPPFLVMPLLEGGTLRERFAKGPMKVEDAIALVAHLAKIVGRAHERGVVHRDLKPGNVLFASHGAPALVGDLGLAKHFRRDVLGASQSQSLSATGFVGGTPGYMAPEQIDDSKSIGPAADVFALGAILHEALTGAKPYDAPNLITYGSALAKGPPPPLRRLRPDAPRWLEEVVLRALAKSPEARFTDGHALARALHEGRSRGIPTWTAVLGVLLLGIAGAVAAVARRAPSPPPPVPAAPPAPSRPPRIEPAARKRSPEAIALATRARNAQRAGRDEEAILLYTQVLALEPTWGAAFSARGSSHFILKHQEEALRDVERGAELAPEDPDAWRDLAMVRASTDNTGALEACARGLALAPENATLLATRGVLRFGRRELREARLDLDRAIQGDPDSYYALDARMRLRERDDPEGALADIARLEKLNPGSWGAIRATLEERVRTVEERRARAIELGRLGNDARKRGDYPSAVELLTQALETGAAESNVLRMRASAFTALEQWRPAEEDATRFLALEPLNASTLTVRGYARAALGRTEEALADLDASAALDPREPLTFLARGKAHFRRRDHAGARADFDRSIELNPMAETLSLRAQLRRDAGDFAGAYEDADHALRLEPTRPSALIERALAHSALGRHDAAMTDWFKLKLRHPKHPQLEYLEKTLNAANPKPRKTDPDPRPR